MKEVDSVTTSELKRLSERMSEPLVKAVVDVSERRMVVDAGLHSDEELYLLENGASQENLWGINLWPDEYGTDEFVEFDSMINIRPRQKNRSRGVEDAAIRELILKIVSEKVSEA